MLEQRAHVIAVTPHDLMLQPVSRDDCPRCASGQGCGAMLFGQGSKRAGAFPLARVDTLPLAVGDIVVLGLEPALLQRLAFALYGLPLLALLATAGLLQATALNEALQVALATGVMLLGFVGVHRWQRRVTRRPVLTVLRREATAYCSESAS